MLKLFHAATWLLAMTVSVGPGYGSSPPVGPCVVLNQVRMAPMAIDCTVAGSVSRRAESGAFGFFTLRVSHPPASTRAATRPSTSGIRLIRLISRTLLEKFGPRDQKLISTTPVRVRKFGYENPSNRNEEWSPDRPATSVS